MSMFDTVVRASSCKKIINAEWYGHNVIAGLLLAFIV